MAVVRYDRATWAAIRRAWCETALSAAELSAQFGPARSSIQLRSVKESWGPRPEKPVRVLHEAPEKILEAIALAAHEGAGEARLREVAFDAAKRMEDEAARRLAGRAADPHATRLARSYRLIDLQLDQLEKLIMSADTLSAQDQERMTRAVSTIAAKVEASGERALEHGKSSPAQTEPAGRAETIDRMRREIAERLERLNAEWLAQQKSP